MTISDPLKIHAVMRSLDAKNALVAAVPPNKGTDFSVEVGTLKALTSNGGLRHPADILLLDVDTDDPDDLEALHRIRRSKSEGVAIIVTAEAVSTSVMRRLLREGIDDFLPQPVSPGELSETLHAAERALRERSAGAPRKGQVMSFTRASGGAGATTLAVHTACVLSRKPWREPAKKVCLIDLDVQFGSVGLYLDVDGGTGLMDAIRSPDRLDADLLHGMTTRCQSGFDVLSAPPTPVPLEALTPASVNRLLDVAEEEYDWTVVDMPHALAHWTDTVLARSARIGVVTELTVPAVRQTDKLLRLLAEEGHPALPISLVLNKYRRHWGSQVRVAQAEKALGHAFEWVIPDDNGLVTAAINQGVPVFDIKRRSRFGKAIRAMTEASVREMTRGRAPAAVPSLG